MTDIPDGWEATEYQRKDGAYVIFARGFWSARYADYSPRYPRFHGIVRNRRGSFDFPTAAAAIAALEEAERG